MALTSNSKGAVESLFPTFSSSNAAARLNASGETTHIRKAWFLRTKDLESQCPAATMHAACACTSSRNTTGHTRDKQAKKLGRHHSRVHGHLHAFSLLLGTSVVYFIVVRAHRMLKQAQHGALHASVPAMHSRRRETTPTDTTNTITKGHTTPTHRLECGTRITC